MPTSDASEPRAAAEAAHLTFFLGDEEYGVPLARVAEIAPDEGLTRVPGTPGLLRGVVSVAGLAVLMVVTAVVAVLVVGGVALPCGSFLLLGFMAVVVMMLVSVVAACSHEACR